MIGEHRTHTAGLPSTPTVSSASVESLAPKLLRPCNVTVTWPRRSSFCARRTSPCAADCSTAHRPNTNVAPTKVVRGLPVRIPVRGTRQRSYSGPPHGLTRHRP